MPWHSSLFSQSVSFFSVSINKQNMDIQRGERGEKYNLHVDKMSSDLLPINYPLYFVWQQSRLSQGITMEISTGGSNRRHILSHCLLIGQCSDLVQISDFPLFYFPQQQTPTCRTFQFWTFQRNANCKTLLANQSEWKPSVFFLLNSEIRLQVFCSPLFVESCGYWQYSV